MRQNQIETSIWLSCAVGFIVAATVFMGGCSSSNRSGSTDEYFDPVRVTRLGGGTDGNDLTVLSITGGTEPQLRQMLRDQNRRMAELERRLATVESERGVAAVEFGHHNELTPGEQELLAMVRQQHVRLEEILNQVRLMAERRDGATRMRSSKAPRTPTTPSYVRASYASAVETYQKGRYSEAERLFERALQISNGSELADNCRFWIGVSRFQRNDLSGAGAALGPVVRDRTSDKRMAAILMLGQVYERLGRHDLARASYTQIVRDQPTSSLRVIAQQKLAMVQGTR